MRLSGQKELVLAPYYCIPPCRDCSFYLFLQREPFVYLRNTSIRWHSLSQFFCRKRLLCVHAALPESRFYSSLYAETSMISRHGSASCIPPPSIRLFVCSCLGKAFMSRSTLSILVYCHLVQKGLVSFHPVYEPMNPFLCLDFVFHMQQVFG